MNFSSVTLVDDASTIGSVSSFNTRSGDIILTSTDVSTALGYAPVNKTGDTMSGQLILSANPTNVLGATPKQYVDALVGSLAVAFTVTGGLVFAGTALSVGTVSTSRIVINSNSIDLATSGVSTGTYKSVTVDAYGRVTGGTNPSTISGFGIADAVNKTGDTMTGSLILNANPTVALGAATKQYVDSVISGSAFTVTGGLTYSGSHLAIGTVSSSRIVINSSNIDLATVGTAGTYNSVTTDAYGRVTAGSATSATTLAGYGITDAVHKSGDSMSGLLILSGDPTVSLGAATKQYVDTAISGGSISVAGGLLYNLSTLVLQVSTASSSRIVVNSSNIDLAMIGTIGTYTKVSVDAYGRVSSGTTPTTLAGYSIGDALNIAGGTLVGPLVLNADPTVSLGAATKRYVDAAIVAASGSFTVTGGLTYSGSYLAVATASSSRIVINSSNIDLATIGTAGTYKIVTVDAYGRIASGSNPSTISGFGITDAVNKTGDTMTGSLILNANPTALLGAATKQYVDSAISGTAPTFTVGGGLTYASNILSVTTASSSRIVINSGNIDLATIGTAGTYKSVTVDAYGRVSSGTTPTTLAGYSIADAVNKTGDTMTGSLILNANPTVALGAATKQYVDASSGALTIHAACITSSATALPACTYNNGAAGVGATLTASSNASINTSGIGGYSSLVVNDRVLIKNQSTQTQNGIYYVTTIGSVGTSWVLTRVTDYDGSSSGVVKAGDLVYILQGTLANTQWGQSTIGSGFPGNYIVFGTDNIVLAQISGSMAAGTGIGVSGGTISNTGVLSNIAGSNISVSSATGNVTISVSGTVPQASSSTNLSGGLANEIAYQTGTGVTSFLSAGTAGMELFSGGAGSPPYWAYDTSTFYGDVTGNDTGSGTITLTLINTGTPGTYNSVTVDSKGRVTGGSSPTTLSGYGITDAVHTSGDTMTGNLVMGTSDTVSTSNNYITRVRDPSNPQDAATKHYVDIATGTVAITANNGLTLVSGVLNIVPVSSSRLVVATGTIDLATSGVSAGTITGNGISLVIDAYGRITSTSTPALTNATITLTGDVTGSGTTSISTTLANSGVTAGSNYNKFNVDARGRVTFGTTATTFSTIGISDGLGSLNNVVLTSPTSSQVLSYNGTAWVNATPAAVSDKLVGTTVTDVSPGYLFDKLKLSNNLIASVEYPSANEFLRLDLSAPIGLTGAATSGYQIINIGGAALSITSTGLTSGTTYTASVTINSNVFPLSILGSSVPTIGDLINSISASIGAYGIVDIISGNIKIVSAGAGTASTVAIIDTGTNHLFASLTGYVSINSAVSGTTSGPYNTFDVDTKGRIISASNLAGSNQPITLSGDATGTGATAITVVLANVGTAGTYKSVTTDAKGRVVSGSSPTTLAGYGITDAQASNSYLTGITTMGAGIPANTGSGTIVSRTITGTSGQVTITNGTGVSGNPTIALSSGIIGTPGTYTKVTIDTYGRATAGTTITTADVGGLGTMSAQNSSSVSITGGTINGTIILPRINSASYGSTVSLNWGASDIIRITLTGDVIITNSTAGVGDGQKCILEIMQDSTGGHAVTFTSETKFGTDITGFTPTATASKMDRIGMIYRAYSTTFDVVAIIRGY